MTTATATAAPKISIIVKRPGEKKRPYTVNLPKAPGTGRAAAWLKVNAPIALVLDQHTATLKGGGTVECKLPATIHDFYASESAEPLPARPVDLFPENTPAPQDGGQDAGAEQDPAQPSIPSKSKLHRLDTDELRSLAAQLGLDATGVETKKALVELLDGARRE
jgi:hypothetical protein